MLTMDKPVVIPFRWVGHGLDLRMTVVAGAPYFAAADVCLALQIRLPRSGEFPAETLLAPGVTDPAGALLDLFSVDQVVQLHADQPMYLDNGFLDWFESLIGTHAIDRDHLNQLVDGAMPDEPGHKHANAYSVARAAHILTTEHELPFGQERLFRAMNGLSWIERDTTDTWVPTESPVRAGYLVRRKVRVPQRQGFYPQILITDAGVLALASLLAQPNDLMEHA